VKGRLVPRNDLDPELRETLLRLLERHFEGVTPGAFERDLDDKHWVLLLEDRTGLRGFSTLRVDPTRHDGEDLVVVYSGDTIVEPDAWGSSALAVSWIGAVVRLTAAWPGRRPYWLLLSSGFRTYRFLSVFWREFLPRHDRAATPEAVDRLRTLAGERLGAQFDPDTGVARLVSPQALRGELSLVPAARREDPHVAFFLERNPGWSRGDELVCLAELRRDHLTAAGLRMWRAAGLP